MSLGIDYAWKHPNPAAIKRDGYAFVLRYLSTDATKNLTAGEAAALHVAGLDIGLIWETTSTRATAGSAAGRADRITAERQAQRLGYPAGAVLFWACDEQVNPAAVMGYARGWLGGGPRTRPTGPYGDKAVIEAVHKAGLSTVEWQTEAWSGTAVSGQADIYQRVKTTRPSLGGGYDEDVLLHPVPLWSHVPPAPKPTPSPVPVPATVPASPVPDVVAKTAWFAKVRSLLVQLLKLFGIK